MSSERGGIVTGWLLKLVVSLALVGVAAFEVGAIVVAKASVETVANDVLDEAVEAYRPSENEQQAQEAAQAEAERRGAVLESFEVSTDQIVVTVSKEAKTILVHRIGFTEDWAIARSTQRRFVG